ncbi:unnamed protein product [Cunninghamella blakesleeana]
MEIKRILSKLQSNKKHPHQEKDKNKKKRLSKWRDKWNQSKMFTHQQQDTSFEQQDNHPYSIQKRHHSIHDLHPSTSFSSLHEHQSHKRKEEIGKSIQRPFSCIPSTMTTHPHPKERLLLSVPHVIDELRATSPSTSSILPRHSTSSSIYTSSSSYYSRIDILNPSSTSSSLHQPQHDHEKVSFFLLKEDQVKDEKKEKNEIQSIDEQSNEDHFTTSTTLHQHDSKYDIYQNDKNHHKELVQMNVTNTMMMMREHQLELALTKMKIENQQLQQQMDDIANGTWTSTTQLLEENERLEREIEQLKRNHPSFVVPHVHKDDRISSLYQLNEEEETLRHTRAQLGLIEYLEGEPDILDALKRFKTLLISSTDLYSSSMQS